MFAQIPRLIFALVFTVPVSGVMGAASASDWKISKISGREYVSADEIRDFYGFIRYVKEDKNCIFRHSSLFMSWKVGSKEIYINNTKFNLSFEIREEDDKAMISTVDLTKLVDPVLRPSYIRDPIHFDTVVIDPGHGGDDVGARGVKGLEKNYALDVSKKLAEELKKRGLKTLMTRSDDTFITLDGRVTYANKQKNAIFVSIHFNSSGNTSASGIETYALAPQGTSSTNGSYPYKTLLEGHERDAENIALATAVHAHAIYKLKAIDRGVKRARFNVLKGINKPAILFEGGFISNPGEGKLVDDESHRRLLAETIADAIVHFQTSVGNSSQLSSSN